jgi:hypothetical protein
MDNEPTTTTTHDTDMTDKKGKTKVSLMFQSQKNPINSNLN